MPAYDGRVDLGGNGAVRARGAGPASPRRASPTSPGLRTLRGVVVGVAASALAWGGHSAASGMVPDPSTLLWAASAAVPVAVVASGRRWRTWSLLAFLLGAQAAFHVAFAGMHGPSDPSGAAGSMAAAMGRPGDTTGAMTAAVASHPALAMVLGHAVAALVTAVLLRRGENWCWAVVRLLRTPLSLPSELPPLLTTPRARVAPPWISPAVRRVLLVDSRSRRGPPATAR